MKTLFSLIILASIASGCGKKEESSEQNLDSTPTAKVTDTTIVSPFAKTASMQVAMTSSESCRNGKCIPVEKIIYTYSKEDLLQSKISYALNEDGTSSEVSYKFEYIYNSDKKIIQEKFLNQVGATQYVLNYIYAKDGKIITKTKDEKCAIIDSSMVVVCSQKNVSRDEIILDSKARIIQTNSYNTDNLLISSEMNEYNTDSSIALNYIMNSVYKSKENPVSKTVYSYSGKASTQIYYTRDTDKLDIYSTTVQTLDDKSRIIKEETTYPGSTNVDRVTFTYLD